MLNAAARPHKPAIRFWIDRARGRPCAVLIALNLALFVWLASAVLLRPGSYDLAPPYARHAWQLAIAVSNHFQGCCRHYVGSQDVLRAFIDLPAPSPEHVRFAASDHRRINQLLAEAAARTVDPKGPRFINFMGDLGYTDYFIIAFMLFGPRVEGFVYLFVILLALPLALILWRFRRDEAVLLTALFVLAGITTRILWLGADGTSPSVYNSRVLEILAVLPTLHLTAAVMRGAAGRAAWIGNAVQALLFAFVVYARGSAAVLILIPFGAAALSFIRWVAAQARRHEGCLNLRAAGARLVSLSALWWLIVFMGIKSAYPALVLDDYTRDRSGHHVWHEIYKGFLWGDPAWAAHGALDNDGGARAAADAWLKKNLNIGVRDIQEAPRGMQLYEHALRQVVLDMMLRHPALTLSTFLISKPLTYLRQTATGPRSIWPAFLFSPALALTLVAALLTGLGRRRGLAGFPLGFAAAGLLCGLSLIALVYYTAASAGLAVAFQAALLYALIGLAAGRLLPFILPGKQPP